MPSFSFTRAKLNALYDHVSGDITCRRPDGPGEEKLNGIHEPLLDADAPFAVSPVTSAGELAFYAVTLDPVSAGEADERLPATFVTKLEDDEGEKVTLVYAISGAMVDDPRFPDPEWVYTHEPIVAGDLENPPVYDPAIVSRALFTQDINDARQYGTFLDGQLDLPLRISTGRNSHDRSWPAADMTLGQFFTALSTHEEGEKDGRAFTQGEAIEGQRTKNAMKNMVLLGGDIDTGMPLEEVHDIVLRSGLTAILYTTHSHMTQRTAVSYDQLVRWMKKSGRGEDDPTIEDVRAFLLDVRDLDPRVAATIRTFAVEQTTKGKQAIVEHDPMSKCRVLFPLAKPFDFTKEGKLQADAVRKWAGKIRGLFSRLGIAIDESCTDPSRLFYMPRHKKGATFAIRIYAGDLLDLDQVETVERGASSAGNAFLAAAEKDAGKEAVDRKDPKRFTAPDGVDILKFVKDHGERWDAMSFFDHHCPDRVRDRKADMVIVECPFDGNHSNAGDTADLACFIAPPGPEHDGGFVWRCRHASCAGQSSTDMLCEAIQQGWFEGKDLFDENFLDQVVEDVAPPPVADSGEPMVRETDQGEAFARVLAEIDSTPEFTDDKVTRILYALAKCGATEVQNERAIERLGKASGIKVTTLRKDFKSQQKIAPSPPKPKKRRERTQLVRFDTDDGFQRNSQNLFDLLKRDQEAEPFIFQKDESLVLKKAKPGGECSFTNLNFLRLRSHVAQKTIWFNDGDADIEPPKAVIEEVLQRFENEAPILDNIVTSPFFDIDGSLYIDQGYHEAVATFINADTSDIPAIPDRPSYDEMIAARDFLLDPFCDFPFKDIDDPSAQSSRAHLLCMILQPLMRRVFEETPTPLYAVNKPQPGSGSSLLVQLVTIIHSGIDPASRALPRNEDEIRKTISGILAARNPVAWFDNVSQIVNSDVLNATLTSTTHADRPMGELNSAAFKNYAQWVVTGNNLRFGKDTARRMLLIRLELDEALDDHREFRHPNVKEYVTRNRPELVAAALTLIRYWFQNRPANWERLDWPTLASFEVFSRVCGSMLDLFEMPGFLGNLAAGADAADEETAAWTGYIQSVFDMVGLGKDLDVGKPGGAFNAAEKTFVQIWDETHSSLDLGPHETSYGRILGRMLRARENSVVSIRDENGARLNVKIRRCQNRTGQIRYMLVNAKDD